MKLTILILFCVLLLDKTVQAVAPKTFEEKVQANIKLIMKDERVVPMKLAFENSWTAAMAEPGGLGSSLDCPEADLAASREAPTSVHSLRPADIKVIAAMGDSLTAGTGVGAQSVLDMLSAGSENRGLVFSIGGDADLSFMTTLPNVLKNLNPALTGASHGIGGVDDVDVSRLNVAVPGAKAKDLLDQAQELVRRVKADPNINAENDWKMVTIFIGSNELCQYCVPDSYADSKRIFPFFTPAPTPSTVSQFGAGIRAALDYLQANLNRTFVNLLDVEHVELLKQVDAAEPFCSFLHGIECPCLNADNSKYSKKYGTSSPFFQDPFGNPFGFPYGKPSRKPTPYSIAEQVKEYQAQIYNISADSSYDTDDFVVVVQQFLANATLPTVAPSPGFRSRSKAPLIDLSFFAPDCFHFSQKGHAIVAKSLWDALLQPTDAKSGGLAMLDSNLTCPDLACPLLRTARNTANCTAFLPPPTTPGPPAIVTAGTIIIPGPTTVSPPPDNSTTPAALTTQQTTTAAALPTAPAASTAPAGNLTAVPLPATVATASGSSAAPPASTAAAANSTSAPLPVTTAAPSNSSSSAPAPASTAAAANSTAVPPPATTAAPSNSTVSVAPPASTAAAANSTAVPPPATTASAGNSSAAPPPATTAAPSNSSASAAPPASTAVAANSTAVPPPATTASAGNSSVAPPLATSAAAASSSASPPPATSGAPVNSTASPPANSSSPSNSSLTTPSSNITANSTGGPPIFMGFAQQLSEDASGPGSEGSMAVAIAITGMLALVVVLLIATVTYRIKRRTRKPAAHEKTPLLSDSIDAQMEQIF